jgi:hypothetical protein
MENDNVMLWFLRQEKLNPLKIILLRLKFHVLLKRVKERITTTTATAATATAATATATAS